MERRVTDNTVFAFALLICVIFVCIVVLVAYSVSFGLQTQLLWFSENDQDWVSFSQYVGGILGPIVAFGALLMLYFAMRYQRDELDAARDIFDSQRFENTFFHLLDSFRLAANSIKYKRGVQVEKQLIRSQIEGRYVFVHYVQGLEDLLNDKKLEIQDVHAGPFDEYGAYVDFSEYYGVLMQIVKYIDEYGKNIESSLYIDILLSHMSDFELRGLFFYGLSNSGKGMKRLIEKYSMLKHLASALLDEVRPYNEYVHLYDDFAYGFDVQRFAFSLSKITKS